MIRAHIFTNVAPAPFLKQFPNHIPEHDGVALTFGLEIPEGIDVLIVYIRASFSIPTKLPRARVVFVAGEPDVIHPYSAEFLNQFGLVLTTSDKPLTTKVIRSNYCSMWFAGFDFSLDWQNGAKLLGYDHFKALSAPAKSDKISIITSDKAGTEYHRKRLAFLDELKQLIPDHLEIYGHGTRSIDDKAEAMLPHKYHLSLENGGGPDTWTEKLSDPLLCWAYPFYAGCTNVEDYIPQGAFEYVDLTDPKGAAQNMVNAITSGRWDAAQADIASARTQLLEHYNLAFMFTRLVKQAYAQPITEDKPWLIRSERSFRPEPGGRGSTLEWLTRRTLLAIDPKIELRMRALLGANDRFKSWKRARRQRAKESKG